MRKLAVPILLAAACGGHPTASTDAASTDAASPDAGAVPAYQGFVNLQTYSGGGGTGYGYGAYFMAGTPGGVFCYAGTMHGDCCVLDGSVTPPAHVSAGRLTITNQSTGRAGATDWSDADHDYGFLTPEITWMPGDALAVTAAGGDTPAFTASATFPVELAGLVVPPHVSIAAGLTVQWTPAGASTVEVYVASETGSAQVACRAPDGAGQLAIPPELLAAYLAPGSGTVIVERKNLGVGDHAPAIVLAPEVSAAPSITVEP